MSLTSLKYDPCHVQSDSKTSLAPGMYILQTPEALFEKKQIFPVNPYVRNSVRYGNAYTPDWVDIHSELSGRVRTSSKCPEHHYQKGTRCSHEQSIVVPVDDEALFTEDTRISNPPCTLRERGVNRWQWMCEDHQQRKLSEFENDIRFQGVHSRIVIKDNHKPIMPSPIDPSITMPPKENFNVDVRYVEDPDINKMAFMKMDNKIVDNSGRTCSEIKQRMPK